LENGNKRNLFFVDAMFGWSSMSKHELQAKIVQTNVDSKNNTSNPRVQDAHIVSNVIGYLTMFDEWRFDMHA
jgi:hypothetical protein